MAGALSMDLPDSCSNSSRTSPSPSPSSTSTLSWSASPIRIRDSAAHPRRSLLSAHFSGEDEKIAKTECPLSADEHSRSLPSLPILAFLDKQEEEALEPTTPPSITSFSVVPMAPRKSVKQRPGPRGKHKPRRLVFSDGDPPSPGKGNTGDAVANSIRHTAGRIIDGAATPPHLSFNSFAASPSPSPVENPLRRVRMRDLR